MTVYRILYRGSLSSCNYSCDYCPFAKTTNTRAELNQDQRDLSRFVQWVEKSDQTLGIFFTPWGEAFIRSHYRRAMVRLSHLPNVQRVAIQTNLSGRLSDLADADLESLALWTTFHPTQVSLESFLHRCAILEEMKIRYSVGVVGLREHFQAITDLRRRLSESVYLWINSYKRDPDYYTTTDLAWLRSIDPYFDLNRQDYRSAGKACRAGHTAFTVDGAGNVRRCHFIDEPVGNLYAAHDIFASLAPRPCPNATCRCHIGYVYRPELQLDQLFGDNVLERMPLNWPRVDARFAQAVHRDTNVYLPVLTD